MRTRFPNALHKQPTISSEEWKKIEELARIASLFLKDTNPIYQILKEDFENSKNIILENRIRDVDEVSLTPATIQDEGFIPEQIKKIFKIPRKIQLDELTGQYKYLKALFESLDSWIAEKERYEREEKEGKILIER